MSRFGVHAQLLNMRITDSRWGWEDKKQSRKRGSYGIGPSQRPICLKGFSSRYELLHVGHPGWRSRGYTEHLADLTLIKHTTASFNKCLVGHVKTHLQQERREAPDIWRLGMFQVTPQVHMFSTRLAQPSHKDLGTGTLQDDKREWREEAAEAATNHLHTGNLNKNGRGAPNLEVRVAVQQNLRNLGEGPLPVLRKGGFCCQPLTPSQGTVSRIKREKVLLQWNRKELSQEGKVMISHETATLTSCA